MKGCSATIGLRALVVAAVLFALPVHAQESSGVQTLGDGDQKLLVVDHGDSWSLHAENFPTDALIRLWHSAGGPQLRSKAPVDRAFTLSVHRLKAERIVERMLEGYSYTLFYAPDGRLAEIRIASLDPALAFKTPRLVETLGRWREQEPAPAAEGGAVPAPGEEAAPAELPPPVAP